MGRTAGSTGTKTAAKIRSTALVLMARHGYAAMSMRDLGAAVGVGAPALYRYYATKQDLLFELLNTHMADLAAAWAAADSTGGTPADRLNAFVANHIGFHVERRLATHVLNLELRGLEKDNLTVILRQRNAYEKQLRGMLRAGQEAGVFDVPDVPLAAMAILQMMTGVVVWYRPGETMPVQDVIKTYQVMAARLAGAASETGLQDKARLS
jgi:AcrR family transcriptional regulator